MEIGSYGYGFLDSIPRPIINIPLFQVKKYQSVAQKMREDNEVLLEKLEVVSKEISGLRTTLKDTNLSSLPLQSLNLGDGSDSNSLNISSSPEFESPEVGLPIPCDRLVGQLSLCPKGRGYVKPMKTINIMVHACGKEELLIITMVPLISG